MAKKKKVEDLTEVETSDSLPPSAVLTVEAVMELEEKVLPEDEFAKELLEEYKEIKTKGRTWIGENVEESGIVVAATYTQEQVDAMLAKQNDRLESLVKSANAYAAELKETLTKNIYLAEKIVSLQAEVDRLNEVILSKEAAEEAQIEQALKRLRMHEEKEAEAVKLKLQAKEKEMEMTNARLAKQTSHRVKANPKRKFMGNK